MANETTATEAEHDRLKDDAGLPRGVLGLLAAGRAELALKRDAEREAREAEAARIRGLTEEALLPAVRIVCETVPAALHQFINWQTERYLTDTPSVISGYEVRLCVPGFMEVTIRLSRCRGPWQLEEGFQTWAWLDGYGPDLQKKSPPATLAEALAVSRECWLQKESQPKRNEE